MESLYTPEFTTKCTGYLQGTKGAVLCDGKLLSGLAQSLNAIQRQIQTYQSAYDEIGQLMRQLDAQLKAERDDAARRIADLERQLQGRATITEQEAARLQTGLAEMQKSLKDAADERDLYKQLLLDIAGRIEQLQNQAQALGAAQIKTIALEPFRQTLAQRPSFEVSTPVPATRTKATEPLAPIGQAKPTIEPSAPMRAKAVTQGSKEQREALIPAKRATQPLPPSEEEF